tara:strand:- start:92 stop:967 length:876 start_codon:yes stop_codon:yes gene_type:complete
MRPSKKKIVRIIENTVAQYLGDKLYTFILFLRYFNNFKRSINREKKSKIHSQNIDEINKYEYKITSQNNEDGIIEYIFKKLPNNKNFIEIGFEYYENNSLNLIKDGWSGILIDQNRAGCLLTRKLINLFFPKNKVDILRTKITRENINTIIDKNRKFEEIDFFSLDVDGNDYWILKDMKLDNIKCICLEFNPWIGKNYKKAVPYDENFNYEDDGFFGASLLAYHDLLKEKNFDLIAIDSSGTNAFFVAHQYSKFFEVLNPIKSFKFNPYQYSEDRKRKITSQVKEHNFIDL